MPIDPEKSRHQAIKDLKKRHVVRHVTFIEKRGWDKWLEVHNVRSFKDQIGCDNWKKLTRNIKKILKERKYGKRTY